MKIKNSKLFVSVVKGNSKLSSDSAIIQCTETGVGIRNKYLEGGIK